MRIASLPLFCLAVLMMAAGCATPAPLACLERPTPARTARVFFATDRRQLATQDGLGFGPERTRPPGLHLGWERVALGPAHRLGRLDPAVAITPVQVQTESAAGLPANALRRTDAEIAYFVERTLRPAIAATPVSRSGEPRQVLVYIHGYNTTFNYAVRKTAQLAGDLELVDCAGHERGVAVAYSWPAQGTLLSYLADEENTEWTQQRLAPFLQALARVCREEHAELTLMAHSMGARALVRSLADLANAGQTQARGERLAHQVILLAPDIGKGLFDQYVERFLPLVDHLTIYVSARDRALSLSRLLHGGHGRLGLLESTVAAALQLAGLKREDHRALAYQSLESDDVRVDMIDVSGSFATQFGHSYEGPDFIRDLRELIVHETPAGTGTRSQLERQIIRPGLFRAAGGRQMRYFRLKNDGAR